MILLCADAVLGFWSGVLSMRCWPVGRPRVWDGWERERVKMRVSQETVVFLERVAFVQDLGDRKVVRDEESVLSGSPFWRASREALSRVPMW